MRNISLFFTVAVSSLWLAGCSDFLDTRVDTNLTPDAMVTDRGTLWSFGNAMYAPLRSGFTALDGNFFAAATDEAQRTQESGYTYLFNRGTISPDNVEEATDSIYKACYEGIRAANFFLKYAQNGESLIALNRDTANDRVNYQKDLRNLIHYRAEAHVLRAYYYLELIKRFGGVPIVENTLDEETNPGQITRSSYDDVVNYIVSEIDNNKANLETDWKKDSDNVATDNGRFELKSALAVKARTLLYAASPLNNPSNDKTKWEKAARAAQDVISCMNYTLPENRDYGAYFQGNNATADAGSIFLVRSDASNTIETNNYPIATPGGNSGVTPTQNLVNAYEYIGTPDSTDPYKNRDPRLTTTVVTNGSEWNGRTIDESAGGTDDMHKANTSKTGYYLKKFVDDNLNLVQGATAYHVWVVFRYADILLMYAEAMDEAYGPDAQPAGFTMTARQALTEVRQSASTLLPAITTTDPEAFLKAVKHERFVELAFEGQRYWDLLRWKDAETILNEPVEGVTIGKDASGNFTYTSTQVATRTFQPRDYLLPFSRAEIVNSNGAMAQNEGY